MPPEVFELLQNVLFIDFESALRQVRDEMVAAVEDRRMQHHFLGARPESQPRVVDIGALGGRLRRRRQRGQAQGGPSLRDSS